MRDNDGGLQSQKNSTGRHYYLTDAHPGSVAAMTNSAGNVVVRYRYGPFGDDRGQIGSLGNSLRFASQEYMPALGITKMGERFYLPKIGRWTQQDPLNQTVDPRNANRYTYAGQDPVNLTDPTGRAVGDACKSGELPNPVGSICGDSAERAIGPIKTALNIVLCGYKLLKTRGTDATSCNQF